MVMVTLTIEMQRISKEDKDAMRWSAATEHWAVDFKAEADDLATATASATADMNKYVTAEQKEWDDWHAKIGAKT